MDDKHDSRAGLDLGLLAIRPSRASDVRYALLPGPPPREGEWDEGRARYGDLYSMHGSVAVVPVKGVCINSAKMGMAPYTAAYPRIIEACSKLVAEVAAGRVSTVVFDIDTPGGMVAGCMHTAAAIEALGKVVDTIGYVDGMACSAGAWLLTACRHRVVTPTAEVGCVGVVQSHVEYSDDFVKVTHIVSDQTPYKIPDLEDEEDVARLKRQVNQIASVFLGEIARMRGLASADAAAEAFGRGDVFSGRELLERGMADEIALLPAVLRARSTPTSKTALAAGRQTTPATGRKGGAMAVDHDAEAPATGPDIVKLTAERDRYQTEATTLRADLVQTRDALAKAEADRDTARAAAAKADERASAAEHRFEAHTALVEGRITAAEVDDYKKSAARRDAGDPDWFNAQFASRKAGQAWPGGSPVAVTHGGEVKAGAKGGHKDDEQDAAAGEAVEKFMKATGRSWHAATSAIQAHAAANGMSFNAAAIKLAG